MDMNNVSNFFRADEVNAASSRIRIFVPSVYKNKRAGEMFCEQLSRLYGIKMVYSNHYTGKVLVVFDENIIKDYHIRREIDRIHKYLISQVNRQPMYKNDRDNSPKYDAVNNKANIVSQTESSNKEDIGWHKMTSSDAVKSLGSDVEYGITKHAAETRLKEYGCNKLGDKKKKSIFKMILESLNDFTTKVLLGSGIVSMIFGGVGDGITILGIIALETLLGISQQIKADKSIDGLKKLSAPNAKVVRDGKQITIPTRNLVPGDILILESGDKVPADARLIDSINLEVNEALLTGEPFPIKKRNIVFENIDVEAADRVNMLYMGTCVTNGRARAVVVETGMGTQMGKIAQMLQNVSEEPTLLETKMQSFGKKLTTICFGLCSILTVGGIIGGRSVVEMVGMGVSLAIGAIPESLPAIVAITMAMGVQRMAKKNAVVRKLPAVETIGSATVICCDKTGTLTKNEMTVKKVYDGSSIFDVDGEGYEYDGGFLLNGKSIDVKEQNSLHKLLYYGSLCSNARLDKMSKSWEVNGDPTEGAILVAAEKAGINTREIGKENKRIKEVPFDSDRKMMSVGCRCSKENVVITKGAVDCVLNICSTIQDGGTIRNINSSDIERILKVNSQMSKNAYRVIGVAYKNMEDEYADESSLESCLTFLGLFGMIDPPRPGVKDAIRKCREAGIKVIMITGDHPDTAEAIGKSIGLLDDGTVMSGKTLDDTTDEELAEKLDNINIFARATPYHKLRIVKAFKKKGHVVAMTGDGVNDAPAIKESDIGISMGAGGTDVAKEASSIVLLDDNFTTIVAAVEEGRTVRYNIKKSMTYLLSGSFGEVFAIFVSVISGMPVPLIPAQILWINLVTESITGASLSMEPPVPNVMKRKPEPVKQELITRQSAVDITLRGIGVGVTTLAAFSWGLYSGKGLYKARTMAFANLIFTQILNVYDFNTSLHDAKAVILRNTYKKWAVLLSSVLTIGAIYLPGLNGIFGTVPLALSDWIQLGILGAASKYHRLIPKENQQIGLNKRYLLPEGK